MAVQGKAQRSTHGHHQQGSRADCDCRPPAASRQVHAAETARRACCINSQPAPTWGEGDKGRQPRPPGGVVVVVDDDDAAHAGLKNRVSLGILRAINTKVLLPWLSAQGVSVRKLRWHPAGTGPGPADCCAGARAGGILHRRQLLAAQHTRGITDSVLRSAAFPARHRWQPPRAAAGGGAPTARPDGRKPPDSLTPPAQQGLLRVAAPHRRSDRVGYAA